MATPKTESIMNFNQVIVSPGTFETVMDITIFESKLTNFFFLANRIENNIQKRAILLSSVSEEIHKVLFSLCVPNTPNDVEYDTLMKCLNKYFKPIKSYFAAWYTFYQAKRRQDESLCQWGALIRDIFVVGMCPGPIQDRLLEEDASKIGVTYSTLIEIATAKEAAINDKSGWKKEEYVDLKYQKENNGHNQAKQGFNTHKELKIKCGVCGRSNHFQKDCRYKDYGCNNCGEKGHLSTLYDNDNDDETVNYDLSNTFFSIIDQNSQNKTVKPFTVNLIVEKNNVTFEIDTGSQHSSYQIRK
ncbi:Uncharacterized protein FWK35_00017595 [Aphis craccivora]|uniref:CCHC-type domain-containing protein n=1 Tax=Aphis craccivora TaxID=307492 RepID=A0A6G0YHG9_APHCR|nr:Uncharacterized protein FWK35_00017595 [Aphis craccivora]